MRAGEPLVTHRPPPAGAEHHASKVTLRPPQRGTPGQPMGPETGTQQPGSTTATTTRQERTHAPASAAPQPHTRSRRSPQNPATHQAATSRTHPSEGHPPLTTHPTATRPADATPARTTAGQPQRSNATRGTQPSQAQTGGMLGRRGYGGGRVAVSQVAWGRSARAPAFRLLACPLFGPLAPKGPVSLWWGVAAWRL